jgi:predicted protein tyrosine phosphatase
LREVLYLAFDDAEPTTSPVLAAQVKLMTAEQARQIWDFVEKHTDEVGAMVVHCEQGISRSPAVAAALCKGRGGNDRKFWREYEPNEYVFRLTLKAAEETKRA